MKSSASDTRLKQRVEEDGGATHEISNDLADASCASQRQATLGQDFVGVSFCNMVHNDDDLGLVWVGYHCDAHESQ